MNSDAGEPLSDLGLLFPITGSLSIMREAPIDLRCKLFRSESARFLRPVASEGHMNALNLSRPLLGFVVGTRAALALGVGLLLADRIPESRRRAIALSL